MAYIPPLNGGRINASIGGNTAGVGSLVSTGTISLIGGNNVTLSQGGNAITFLAGGYNAGMSNVGNTSGTSGLNSNGLVLVGGNNITLSQSTNATGAYVTVSGPVLSNAGGALTLSNTSNSINVSVPATSSMVGTNGVSVSSFGSTVSVGFNVPKRWAEIPAMQANLTNLTNLQSINGIPIFQPFFNEGLLSISRIQMELSRSTTASNRFTVFAGIYSYMNDTQVSLMASLSNSFSNTATASNSGLIRMAVSGLNISTFGPGEYVLGMIFTVGTASSASMNYSLRGNANATHAAYMLPGTDIYNTFVSVGGAPFFGRMSTSSAALPTVVSGNMLYGQFGGASAPLNWWVGMQDQ